MARQVPPLSSFLSQGTGTGPPGGGAPLWQAGCFGLKAAAVLAARKTLPPLLQQVKFGALPTASVTTRNTFHDFPVRQGQLLHMHRTPALTL